MAEKMFSTLVDEKVIDKLRRKAIQDKTTVKKLVGDALKKIVGGV